MKTQGVSLGPQLLGHARSFNLYCLSKGCGCVHTPKNSSDWIQGQKELRYESQSLRNCIWTHQRWQGSQKATALFSQLQTWVSPTMKRELNSREISRHLDIIFSIMYIRQNPGSKKATKTPRKKIYTQTLIISVSVKLKLSENGGQGWGMWFRLGSKEVKFRVFL